MGSKKGNRRVGDVEVEIEVRWWCWWCSWEREGGDELNWLGPTFSAFIGMNGEDEDAFGERVRHVRHDAEDIPVEPHFPSLFVYSCLLPKKWSRGVSRSCSSTWPSRVRGCRR